MLDYKNPLNIQLSLGHRCASYCLSRSRMVTERLFGLLKARWRFLYNKSEGYQHSFKVKILTCIVLYNICKEKRNSISHKLDLSYDKNENARKSRKRIEKNGV